MKSYKKILLVILVPLFVGAATDQELFESANELYQQEKFESALEKYNAISDKNSSVFQNIGQCYFYLKQYPQAFAYWGKAARGASWAARRNLYALQQNIPGYKKYRSWMTIVFDEIRWLLSGWSLLFLQLLFLFCWFFCLGCWVYVTKRRYVFSSLLSLVILIPFLWVKWIDEQPCCVVSLQAPVFVGPNSSYQTIGQLQPLSVAYVHEELSGWYKIKCENTKGWVAQECIQLI